MPALPYLVIDPLWSQFKALLPKPIDEHPLGCHRPRVADRVVFDKLIARLVLGGAYTKHADDTVSATTLRTRRNEWIAAGVFVALEQGVLENFDRTIGLDLEHLTVDECCVKAPCGEENTGPNPTDRGKSGQKRSVFTHGNGLPTGVVLAGANRHNSPLLEPTLDCLGRFGFFLPERIRVDLDAGYDSGITRELLASKGCVWKISPKGDIHRDQSPSPLEGGTDELVAHARVRTPAGRPRPDSGCAGCVGEIGEHDHRGQTPIVGVMDTLPMAYQARQAIPVAINAYPRNLLKGNGAPIFILDPPMRVVGSSRVWNGNAPPELGKW